MDNNLRFVEESDELGSRARERVERSIDVARLFVSGAHPELECTKGGRKAQRLHIVE